jgi:hypothetical protein
LIISGQYPLCPTGIYGGYFSGPDFSGDGNFNTGCGVFIQADGVVVHGIRVVGKGPTRDTNPQNINGNLCFASNSGGIFTATCYDCVADQIKMVPGPLASTWNNQKNAAYEISCSGLTDRIADRGFGKFRKR